MITLFTAPKPFLDQHISTIQFNAVRSWKELGAEVEILLIGDEPGLQEAAQELGVAQLKVPSRAPSGAPIVSELFYAARQAAHHSLLGYVNADIILLDDFLASVKLAAASLPRFLMVGNRWDVDLDQRLVMEAAWDRDLRDHVMAHGRQHSPMGSDYFVYSAGEFTSIPPFTLGRSGWDNWMMYWARAQGIPLIDASRVITAIHQEHDYAHLPGGIPHYRHPESQGNIDLAGGYEAMFRLRDADWILSSEGLRPKRFKEWEWPRKLEADLIARFRTGTWAKLTRMVFHPRDALAYFQHKFLRASAPRDRASGGQGPSL